MTAFRSNVLQPCSISLLWWHVKDFPFENWHRRGSILQKGVTARTLLRVHFCPHPPHTPRQWGDGKSIQGCLSTCKNHGESCVGRRGTCFHVSSGRDLLFQAPKQQQCSGIKVRGSLWWCGGCALLTGQEGLDRVVWLQMWKRDCWDKASQSKGRVLCPNIQLQKDIHRGRFDL